MQICNRDSTKVENAPPIQQQFTLLLSKDDTEEIHMEHQLTW